MCFWRSQQMKIHRLDHIHVYCSDPDTSVRFYTGVFEAEMLGKAYSSDGGVRYFLRLGGLAIVLAPYPVGAEPNIPTVYRDGIYEHGYGVGHFGLHAAKIGEHSFKPSPPAQGKRTAMGCGVRPNGLDRGLNCRQCPLRA